MTQGLLPLCRSPTAEQAYSSVSTRCTYAKAKGPRRGARRDASRPEGHVGINQGRPSCWASSGPLPLLFTPGPSLRKEGDDFHGSLLWD